jgi:hypothetical protein
MRWPLGKMLRKESFRVARVLVRLIRTGEKRDRKNEFAVSNITPIGMPFQRNESDLL